MLRVELLRRVHGMSQAALGQKVGRSQTRITNIETGQEVPNLEMRLRLAEVLQADPATLLDKVEA